MQSCIVDGRTMDVELIGDWLENLLESVYSDLAKNGRFIASLRVNGMEIADIDGESNRPLDGIRSIEIISDSPVHLARNIIIEGEAFIEGLKDCLVRTAERFMSGDEGAGSHFSEAVQGLQWLVQMIGFIELNLKLDFDRLFLNGKPVVEYVQNLNSIFQDIVKSQEQFDTVLLADILEYDLVPHLDDWKGIFSLLERETAEYADG